MADLRAECLAMAERLKPYPTNTTEEAVALLRRVADALPQEPRDDVVEAGGWQPIETAPPCRDVLCAKWLSDNRCFLVVAQKVPACANRWVSDGGPMTLVPTHWRPLPDLPASPDLAGQRDEVR